MVRPICAEERPVVELTRADVFMRRLLRLPDTPPDITAADARAAFRTSILVSTLRCLLTYIVLPFVLPIVGLATGVSSVVGLLINVVAIVFLTTSVRRFWRVHHRKRWHYTALATVVGSLLLFGIGLDVANLLG
jgi:hypothetical protein